MTPANRGNFGLIFSGDNPPELTTSIQNYKHEFYYKEDSCSESRIGTDSVTVSAIPGKESKRSDNVHRKTRHQR